jgi:choline dehydrogenase
VSQSFDVIVVGGGSAGCVVAGRLAQESELRVALLELGDQAEAHPETLVADGYKHAFKNDALMLERFSSPQPECANSRLFMGSGRGMGGSGSINGMVYTRGAREDYESWPRGWQLDELAPHFAEVEAKLRVRPRPATEFTEAFVESALSAGFRRSADLNGGDLSGVFGYETMNYEGEGRRSSYVAFVKEAARDNLVVLPRTRVLRVVFEGRRAVGVEVEREGRREILRARSEVVLCAGALETPRLLMLSGVGPAAELARLEIPLVHDAPEIGANLHDHPNVTMFFLGARSVDSFYPQLYGFHRANPASDLPAGQSDTCYVMYPARSSFREAAMRMLPARFCSRAGPRASTLPPFYGAASKRTIAAAVAAVTALPPVQRFIERLWGCVVILGKPKSRGRLTLASRDASRQAHIDPRYFSHPEDMATMLAGVKLGRRIAQAAPLEAWGNRPLLPPQKTPSDEQLARFIAENVMTTFHYAGTCRMGDDASAPVDTQLCVRDLSGLRVADASIIPWTPVSALNAPSMMIGHRAADFVLAERRRALQPTEATWPA